MAKKYIVKDVGGLGWAKDLTFETNDLAEAQRTAVKMTATFKFGLTDFRVFEMIEVEA